MGTCDRQAGGWCEDARCLEGCKLLAAGPIPLLLFCPSCAHQHIDAPNPAVGWENPPHRTHLCHNCGYLWRPADVATNGVATLATCGQGDMSPVPSLLQATAGAIQRRDRLWYKTLLVGVPAHVVAALVAIFNRLRPELQATSESHLAVALRMQQQDIAEVTAELDKAPMYTLPQSAADLSR